MEEMQPKTSDRETRPVAQLNMGKKWELGYRKATQHAVDDGSQFEILTDGLESDASKDTQK